MAFLAVIYHPRQEKRTTDIPFGFIGSRAFPFPMEQSVEKITGGKNKIKDTSLLVEIKYTHLHEGVNFINIAEWEQVSNHIANKPYIDALAKSGAIEVYLPEEGKPGRDSSDFDFESAAQIIANSRNQEWLNICLQVERRVSEPDVRQLIIDRLKDLQEETSMRRSAFAGSFR